jgi:uncharacterized circularly permuted ATP-grasp superfamily protein
MMSPDGAVRPPYRALYESTQRSGPQELRSGADSLARAHLNQGVTFDIGGDDADVPPIKGIVAGSPVRADLDVVVEVTRLV